MHTTHPLTALVAISLSATLRRLRWSALWLVALLACGSGVEAGTDKKAEVAAALAAARASKTVERAELVDAVFSHFDEATGILSDVQLTVDYFPDSPQDSVAYLAVVRLHLPSGVALVAGQGIFHFPDASYFTFSNNRKRARLSVPAFPFSDLTHSMDMLLSIDITWEATGKVQLEHSHERTVDPETGVVTRTHYYAWFADAVAKGVVLDGRDGITNWIPAPSVTGRLLKEQLFTITREPR